MQQDQIQRFEGMSPEQLQETAMRMGSSPMAATVQRILAKKRVLNAVDPGAGMPQAYALGGSPQADGKQRVPIIAAGGEYVISPEQVRALGGGDLKRGHAVLDAFVLHIRKRTIKEMSKLRGPVKS